MTESSTEPAAPPRNKLRIPKPILNVGVAAATMLGIISGDASPNHSIAPTNSPATTGFTGERDKGSHTAGVEVYTPAASVELQQLIDTLSNDPSYNHLGSDTQPSLRVLHYLMGTQGEVEEFPGDYVNPHEPFIIHAPTVANKATIDAILSLIPDSVYTPPDVVLSHTPKIYLITGPTRRDPTGYTSTYKNTAPFNGTCECRQGDINDSYGLVPSVLLDRSLVSGSGTTPETAQGAITLIHELNHIRIVAQSTYGEGGTFTNPLISQALQKLGFEIPDDYTFDYNFAPLAKKLVDSKDMESQTNQDGLVAYGWKTQMGYMGKTVQETIPRSVDMYVQGKEFFLAEFTRVFGQASAAQYYSFIKDTFFEGQEYSEDSIRNALNTTNGH